MSPTRRRAASRAKPRPSPFYEKLREAVRHRCVVTRGSRLVVACSGGPDSLALLLGLVEVSRTYRLELTVAHYDHGLRAGSDRDARSVERRCRALGLPFVSQKMGGRRRLRERGLSGEAGLRTMRREFLLRTAEEVGADFIALAHTSDDQAETVLLRLARGSGVLGLSAMRWRRGRWIRPLLGISREEVLRFLRDRRVRARHDPSNRNVQLARNRIRHRVLPELRRINPHVEEAIAATAEHLGRVSRLLDRLGAKAYRAALESESERGIRLVRRNLLGYHPAIRERAIRLAWNRVGDPSHGLTRRHLRDLEMLLQRGVGKTRVNLPQHRVARLDRGLLFLGADTPNPPRIAPGHDPSKEARKAR